MVGITGKRCACRSAWVAPARYDRGVGDGETRGPLLSSLAAIGSVVASMSCCLPIIPILFGAGAAAASAAIARFRLYFVAASVNFLGVAFYRAWAVKRCGRRPGLVRMGLLWIAAAVVVVSIFFPQLVAEVLAR